MKQEEGDKVSVELTAPLARFMHGAVQVEMGFKDEVTQKSRLKFANEASASIMFNVNIADAVRRRTNSLRSEQAYWSQLRRTYTGWYEPLFNQLLKQRQDQDAGEED